MLEQYYLLRRDFLSTAEPFIDCDTLDQLKLNYAHNIDSKRKLSKIKDLKTFLRLLEKRDIVRYDNIEQLRNISKIFIGKSDLESKLLDYENWLETVPMLHLYDMYQYDDTLVSSQEEGSTAKSLTSEPAKSVQNLSQSSKQISNISFNCITQSSHCYSKIDRKNNLDDKRKSLQQTVLLQIKDRLGRSWRDVARHLGIRECEIDAVSNKYPYDMKEQSYEILKIYISQSNAEQWAINLMRALEKGRRKDLRELVENLILKDKDI